MDKSSASSQSQKPSTGRRVRQVPSTPRPEAMTPPTPQSMVLPTVSATQPPETSEGKIYLEILKDAMEKFSPTGKMSEIFTQLANKFKEKEERPNLTPVEDSTGQNQDQEHETEVEWGDEVNYQEGGGDGEGSDEAEEPDEETVREPLEEEDQRKESSEKADKVVVLEDDGSEFDEETMDERAMRRSLRMAWREEMVEVEGKLVESATKAVEKF